MATIPTRRSTRRYRNVPRVHFHIHDRAVMLVRRPRWSSQRHYDVPSGFLNRLSCRGEISLSVPRSLCLSLRHSFPQIFSARLSGCVSHSSSALSVSIRVIAEKRRDPGRDCISIPARRRAGRRFKSAMNRDIPNTHTHNGIKISIGTGVFFSRPRAAPTVGSRSVRGRETPHKDCGPVSLRRASRYARDGSLSSIVPFCLPSFGPFLHPVPSPSPRYPRPFLACTDDSGRRLRREISMGISQPGCVTDVSKYNTWFVYNLPRFLQHGRRRGDRNRRIIAVFLSNLVNTPPFEVSSYRRIPSAFFNARASMIILAHKRRRNRPGNGPREWK